MDDFPDLVRALGRALHREESKPWGEIWQDVQRYVQEHRRFPTHYFTRELYHRDITNPDDFVDQETIRRTDEARYRQPARWLFDDKYHFNLHLKRNEVAVPRVFGYSLGGFFYDLTRRLPLGTFEEFRVLVDSLLEEVEMLFIKDLGGRMGSSITRVTRSSPPSDLREAFETSGGLALIYEEGLQQHPDLDEVYPEALNTIRVINCMTDRGRVETISALMRFGSGGSYVDNSSQGGVFIGIDLESGRLRPPARRFFAHGGGHFDRHPDTGFAFEGFAVPLLDEALALAHDAMLAIPSPLIGWDVGITRKGPVIVEGNAFADLFGAELADGGFRHNEVFQRFVGSMDVDQS
ncbi:MAG: sugar-transfer associated ATP-grasp domain-containing protein, partial [Bacteroidota bacterium]